MDQRIRRLAALVLDYSLEVKEGQTVMVSAATMAEPLVRALVEASAQRGVHLISMLNVSDSQYLFFKHAKDILLDTISPATIQLFETVDAMIGISCTPNPRELSRIEPEKMMRRQKTMRKIYEIIDKREKEGAFRWVAAPYPSPAMAADAEMSLTQYTDFVFGACACDLDNPTAHWREVHKKQERIVQKFNGSKTLHIVGKETDLTLSVEGRTWVNCDGKKNMPDGEIFTSPVETSAEGTIYYDYPAVFRGVEVNGVRLTFKAGKVVEATAEKNEAYLLKMLDTDEGARFLGEVAIGTNFHITDPSKSILFDEKIGGSMHMAVGLSIPETGGENVSGLHWDMIKDMRDGGRWELDGKIVYNNGQFKI